MKPQVSIIIPCYNEMVTLEDGLRRIVDLMKKERVSYEIILIDDYSTDGTRTLIHKLVKKYKYVRSFLHDRNFGRGRTVQDGIMHAKGSIVGYLDIDLEVSEIYIPMCVEKIRKGADMVIGHRHYANESSIIRYLASKSYWYLVKILFDLPFHDTEAGYKFFRRSKILTYASTIKDQHWFWDTEVIIRGKMNNMNIVELPVLYQRRTDKKSSVRLVKDTIQYLRSITSLKRELVQI